jgi:hypothetical protein
MLTCDGLCMQISQGALENKEQIGDDLGRRF